MYPVDSGCRACPLGGQGFSTGIPGRWSDLAMSSSTLALNPMPFIVGEAPGQQEDLNGQVFIGPSGSLLSEAFSEVGIPAYFVTNSVKCFPGRATRPLPASIKACAPQLDEEILREKPTAILALGETAWHRLGGVGGITESEGKEIWSEKYRCWVMPARHPAYILRAMGHRPSWIQVLHRYKTLLAGGLHKEPPVKVRIIDDDRLLMSSAGALNQASYVVYDFETNRLPWWHRDFKALTISFTTSPGVSFVVPLEHSESPFRTEKTLLAKAFWGNIRASMTNPKVKKTAHQGFFDDLVWYRMAGYLPYLTCDTLALAHLLDENRPKGLKWLGRALLGWPDWGIDTKDLDKQPLDQVCTYNGYDTAATWALRDRLLGDLSMEPRLIDYFSKILMPGIRTVEQIMANGISVDTARLGHAVQRALDRREQAAAQIPVVNPGSNPQIAQWLYVDNQIPVQKETPGGAPSTDEETIHRLARTFPAAKLVLAYRQPAKNISTYLLPAQHELDTTVSSGRMHPDYRLGPTNGRLASKFHTTPREVGIRTMYSASPGYVLLSADYRQIESRLVGWAACGRPETWDDIPLTHANFMRALMDPKRDVYVEMAAAVLGKSLSEVTTGKPGENSNDRQIMGKVPTLAMLYRISAGGLLDYAWNEYQIVWTERQARKIHNTFYTLWPEVRTWQEREALIVSKRGWNQSVLGRKVRVPDAMQDGPSAHKALGTGINHPISSLATDITMTAATMMQQYIMGNWIEGGPRLVGFIHDNLLVECRIEQARAVEIVLQATMLNAPMRLQPYGLRIPDGYLQVEIHAGPWGNKQTLAQYFAAQTST